VATSAALRKRLVAELEKLGHITSAPVRDAFRAVPRERFVPAFARSDGLAAVYRNDVVVTKKDEAGQAVSSSSAPSIMALMLEQLELEPGHRVLEVGAGTGYNAALIKHIVGARGRVVSIDIDPMTAREARVNTRAGGATVRVVAGDGRRGYEGAAPYDRIISTASAKDVPRAWHRQLAKTGRVTVPLFLRDECYFPQAVVTLRKTPRGFESVGVVAGGFMALRASADAAAPGVPHVDIRLRNIGPERSIAMLSGESLRGFDDRSLRRVLALALGKGRRRRIPLRPSGAGLLAHLALAGPSGRQAVGIRGLVDARATSFAYLRPGKEHATIVSAGGPWAERRLRSLVEDWRSRGSPQLEQLRIRITYGRTPPRAWRTQRRGSSFVSFDWLPATTHT
jgi:protein-L-isoaspartate(D-aspartate) O-methyltransferase